MPCRATPAHSLGQPRRRGPGLQLNATAPARLPQQEQEQEEPSRGLCEPHLCLRASQLLTSVDAQTWWDLDADTGLLPRKGDTVQHLGSRSRSWNVNQELGF